MIAVKRKVTFVRRSDRSRAIVVANERPTSPVAAGRVPRISRLMALAIHFDRLIREGKVTDLSELARLAHVTQPRTTQIMNLNHLAPDIQEELLFLPQVTSGRVVVHERILRPIAAEVDWRRQRQLRQSLIHLSHRLVQTATMPPCLTRTSGRPEVSKVTSHAHVPNPPC